MNKRGFFLIIILFFSFAIASPQIVMDSSHSFGETILGVVEMGDGAELLIDDLDFVFKKGRKSASLTYDVLKYGSDFYFYIYPSTSGDYSLSIDGILYRQGNSTQAVDLQKNFSVVESSNNVLSVKPGFIYTTDTSELVITNKGNSTLNVGTPGGEIVLAPLGSEVVFVDPFYEFSFFEVNSYKSFKIPVIYYGGSDIPENNSGSGLDINDTLPLILKKSIDVSPKNITIVFDSAESIEKIISIENTGDVDIDGIYFSSDYNASAENITIKKGEKLDIEIEFFINYLDGEIVVGFDSKEIVVPVYVELEESLMTEDETCSDMGGQFCFSSLNLTCDGESEYASDTPDSGVRCCLGECIKIKMKGEGNAFGKVFGVIIFLCLGAGGFFVYKKYKETGSVGFRKKINEERKIPVVKKEDSK
jgi:hypothetical protein